jgi:hypothetical protein
MIHQAGRSQDDARALTTVRPQMEIIMFTKTLFGLLAAIVLTVSSAHAQNCVSPAEEGAASAYPAWMICHR